ncbi:hypothetical protein ZWY2020_021750 [Hordeum vulgare]|nr:hypothetical protein ZWY2020_021750 [Hordeum vulgare]
MAGAAAPPLAAALLAVPAAPAYSRARAATSSSTVSRPSSSPTTTPTSCPTGSTRTSDAPNLSHPTSPSQPPTVATMKLAMEVADAAELSAKNGGASCNPFVEVEFDGQRQRTATRPGDLSPHWNETLVFDVRDPARLSALTVDVSVQHDRSLNDHNAIRPHAFLGRVRVSGDSVTRSPYEAVVQRYPLHKRGLFSRVSGDIALRLYLVADTRDGDRVTQDHAAPSVDTGGGLQQNLQQPSQPAAAASLDPERMVTNVFSGEVPAGASIASGAAAAETNGKSGHDTREFRSIPASSGVGNEPRRHTLHAMAAPPARRRG